MPGEAARFRHDGGGPAHGRHGVGGGVGQKHDRAFGKVGHILAFDHGGHGAAAHAPGGHVAVGQQGPQVPQGRGSGQFGRAVQAHGAGLQQDNLIILVHSPFHVLGVLVVAFQIQHHAGQGAGLVVAQAGHVAQGVGHGFQQAFHQTARRAGKAQAHFFVSYGGLDDFARGARNQPLVRRAGAVHHHFAQAPEPVDDHAVRAQVYGMA